MLLPLSRQPTHQLAYSSSVIKTLAKVLVLMHLMAPHFLPWHGVITGNHQENDKQILCALTHREEGIGAVVGAGMASTTGSINL